MTVASIKDDQGYNQMYKSSSALKIRTERRCKYICSIIKIKKEGKILEIGCGTGELAYQLAKKTGMDVLGIDKCGTFIKTAQSTYSLPNLSFTVLDIKCPGSLAAEQYNYIVGNGILHHLYYKIDQSLLIIYKLLIKNGKIIFLEPNFLNPYCYAIFSFSPFRKWAHLAPDEMAFTKSYIINKLFKAKFSNAIVVYKDFLLPITPKALITTCIAVGSVLERVPLLKLLSQSIFISAEKVD